MLAKVRPLEGTPAAEYFEERGMVKILEEQLTYFSRLYKEGHLDSEPYFEAVESLQRRISMLKNGIGTD